MKRKFIQQREKYIRVDKTDLESVEYELLVSSNGFQWTAVLHGSLDSCMVVLKAYLKLGLILKLKKEGES